MFGLATGPLPRRLRLNIVLWAVAGVAVTRGTQSRRALLRPPPDPRAWHPRWRVALFTCTLSTRALPPLGRPPAMKGDGDHARDATNGRHGGAAGRRDGSRRSSLARGAGSQGSQGHRRHQRTAWRRLAASARHAATDRAAGACEQRRRRGGRTGCLARCDAYGDHDVHARDHAHGDCNRDADGHDHGGRNRDADGHDHASRADRHAEPRGAGARGGHLRREAWPRTARHQGAVRHARAPQDDRRGGPRATRRGPRDRIVGVAWRPAWESLPELPPPLRDPRRASGVVLRRHAPQS